MMCNWDMHCHGDPLYNATVRLPGGTPQKRRLCLSHFLHLRKSDKYNLEEVEKL